MITQCVQSPEVLTESRVDDYYLDLEDAKRQPNRMTDLVNAEALKHLFYFLPIQTIWIETTGPLAQNKARYFRAKQRDSISLKAMENFVQDYWQSAYWQSMRWQRISRSPLTVSEIEVEASLPIADYVYICVYGEERLELGGTANSPTLSGYWLIGCDTPLLDIHKHCIQQQVRTLQAKQQSLLEHSQLHRQIQSLKKALSKTEHQLKTPLALVELYAELLQKSSPTQPVRDQAECIAHTVKDIMISLNRLTRWDDTSRQTLVDSDVAQVIAECVEDLQPYAAQKAVSIVCDHTPLPLTVDPWQIKQVFHNLLNNAIAFTPAGSTITCQWKTLPKEMIITITDQGSGFSTEDLDNLFTPFYSRRPDGTGVGLVIARDIIQAHQGQLSVANSADGGAAISIVLPR